MSMARLWRDQANDKRRAQLHSSCLGVGAVVARKCIKSLRTYSCSSLVRWAAICSGGSEEVGEGQSSHELISAVEPMSLQHIGCA